MNRLAFLCAAFALVLSGCAAPRAGYGVASGSSSATKSGTAGGTVTLKSITPMTAFADFPPSAQGVFSDSYTRLIITSNLSAGGANTADDYMSYQQRHVFERFFWGLHSSLNLTANVKVSGGQAPFSATVPLISMDHVSDAASGEQFTRMVTHRAENFPLFLVNKSGSDAIVSVTFDLKASDTPTGSAANALSLAQSITTLVAPQAAVLTTLSAQSTQQIASALNQAVAQLFTKSVEEEPMGDRDIRTWPPGNGFVVTLQIPGEGDWLSQPTNTIGSWTVTFDNPQPSIFSGAQICSSSPSANASAQGTPPLGGSGQCFSSFAEAAKQAETDADALSVLNFQLTSAGNSLGSISAYLAQQTWFASSLSSFANGVTAEGTTKLCQSIKNSMVALGLNDIDAGIVTVAARSMTQIPQKVVAQMKATANAGQCGFAPVTSAVTPG